MKSTCHFVHWRFLLIILGLLWGSGIVLGDEIIDPLYKPAVDYKNVRVEKILGANSLLLENRERVKLIGLKAPEVSSRTLADERFKHIEYQKDSLSTSPNYIPERKVDPQVPVTTRAYQFTKELLLGKHVRLEFDAQNKDDDFYTLAYVYLPDGTFVNQEILRQGYAILNIIPPNTKYADILREAYQESRTEKRGLQSE